MNPVSPVCTITDEELLALTGEAGLVMHPYAAGLDSAQQQLAVEVARRSLRLRGVLVPGPDGQGWVDGTGVLSSLLEVRAGAPVVLVMHRLLGPLAPAGLDVATSAVRYLHVLDDLAVVEDVTEDGFHALGASTRPSWLAALGQFLVPPALWSDPAGESGTGAGLPAVAAPPAADAPPAVDAVAVGDRLLAALGHPVVIADVLLRTVCTRQAQTWMLTFAESGCHLSRDGGATFHACTAESMLYLLATVLEEAVDAVRSQIRQDRPQ